MRLAGGKAMRRMRRVLKFWQAGVLAAVAAALAGCATSSRPATTLAPSTRTAPVPVTQVPEPVVVAPPAPLVITSAVPAVVVVSNLPPAAAKPAWPTNWSNAWIPLESWAQFNGLEKPRQLTAGLDGAFQFATSRGAGLLRMGNHKLRFGGLDFRLGFAPKLIKGLPYIHAVDARKTLQPLLGPAWRLPGTNRVIVIDAGHGGKDSGTKSAINNEYEKFYTLDWARRLGQLLTARGWTVVLTRTNDLALTLSNRVAIAEQVKADLFLSLHFNHGPGNGELSGVETYCLAPTGMPSSLDRGFGDDTREWHPNNAFDEQNFQLATALHRAVLGTTGAADRAVCRARFFGVLRGQNRPAVLIEGGYLSNPAEARKIATSTYRQTLAEGVAKALE